MSIWRKLLGRPLDPKVPEPPKGMLHILDDENVLSAHKIVAARYNIYEEAGHSWLTIRIEADKAHRPPSEPDTETFIELNMVTDGMARALLLPGAILKMPAYSEELGNLTNMYHYTHSNFDDATVELEAAGQSEVDARISGKTDCDPVLLRCRLTLDSVLKRSFS